MNDNNNIGCRNMQGNEYFLVILYGFKNKTNFGIFIHTSEYQISDEIKYVETFSIFSTLYLLYIFYMYIRCDRVTYTKPIIL